MHHLGRLVDWRDSGEERIEGGIPRPALRSAPLGPHRELSTRATTSCPVGPDVQIHSTGVQLIHNPVVSDLDLSFRPSH
jgi:hypothetical protein